MKKLLSILVLQLVVLSHILAQGQGEVRVINNMDCPVGIDLFAACPDGTHYMLNHSFSVPGSSTVTIYSTLSGPAMPSPWLSEPACTNWEWQYCSINTLAGYLAVMGNVTTTYPFYVASFFNATDNVMPGLYFEDLSNQLANECGHGIKHATYKWNYVGGDIEITINP